MTDEEAMAMMPQLQMLVRAVRDREPLVVERVLRKNPRAIAVLAAELITELADVNAALRKDLADAKERNIELRGYLYGPQSTKGKKRKR